MSKTVAKLLVEDVLETIETSNDKHCEQVCCWRKFQVSTLILWLQPVWYRCAAAKEQTMAIQPQLTQHEAIQPQDVSGRVFWLKSWPRFCIRLCVFYLTPKNWSTDLVTRLFFLNVLTMFWSPVFVIRLCFLVIRFFKYYDYVSLTVWSQFLSLKFASSTSFTMFVHSFCHQILFP